MPAPPWLCADADDALLDSAHDMLPMAVQVGEERKAPHLTDLVGQIYHVDIQVVRRHYSAS